MQELGLFAFVRYTLSCVGKTASKLNPTVGRGYPTLVGITNMLTRVLS